MESFANGSGCPVVSLFYCGKGQQMERVIERGVKVLEKIEKDLSGIKAELELIRKGQEGPHKKNIGMMASPTVTITKKGVKRDAAGQQHILHQGKFQHGRCKKDIKGIQGYFNDLRIDPKTVPEGFHFWELADGDYVFCQPFF